MFHITTERLVLGPQSMENLEKLNVWFNDKELAYYDDDEPEQKAAETLEETRAILERILRAPPDGRIIHYGIYKKSDGTLIGYGQVGSIDLYNRRCRLGITIGEKQEWGKGYAKEALTAIIEYGFKELNFNRIGAEIYEFNPRSIHLFESLGFKREGVVRQNVVKKGEFRNEFVYGLLKIEWEALERLQTAHKSPHPWPQAIFSSSKENAQQKPQDPKNHLFEPDGPFYLALARRFGGPVLDIGCGTGRITIPLAEQGFDVTGLDTAEEILALARIKSPGLPVHWAEGEARSFHLGTTFRLIYDASYTFQHLLERTGQEAMLERVRIHLALGGYFALHLEFPRLEQMVHQEAERERYSFEDELGRMVHVLGKQQYDPLNQIKTETTILRRREADGHDTFQTMTRMMRYTFPEEMQALLRNSGFRILERYGNFDFRPMTGESRLMVYLCQISD